MNTHIGELSDTDSEWIGKVISDEVTQLTQRLDDVEKHVAKIRRELRIIWILLFFIDSGFSGKKKMKAIGSKKYSLITQLPDTLAERS